LTPSDHSSDFAGQPVKKGSRRTRGRWGGQGWTAVRLCISGPDVQLSPGVDRGGSVRPGAKAAHDLRIVLDGDRRSEGWTGVDRGGSEGLRRPGRVRRKRRP